MSLLLNSKGKESSLVQAVKVAKEIFVVTGAGISQESGVPTFRSKGGWWKKLNPEKLATGRAFKDNPEKVWQWYDYRRKMLSEVEPNQAHKSIAQWEKSGKKVIILTQNVDNLHERAGSNNVFHIHGNIWQLKCLENNHVYRDERPQLPELPPKCKYCQSICRPNVVWFDEDLEEELVEQIEHLVGNSFFDLILSIGTTSYFDYIRKWTLKAAESKAMLIEINPEQTLLSGDADECVRHPVSKLFEKENI
ncbi:SIR2 family NAD-dependent protein deacylase [Rhodohalobacter sulfatireducens]|uniref:protein acetyllysine N-acetyltransferase n=1 Tax=Rhodohalobacter sulfatireducens TaxID=2911366 RepID=A0ABS9K8C8_9BACT|nr:NAD-dependent protein deacylase [Rhodohalobacter sulfatireducens]MCG2587109.1 NAD-dependent protein deacylase [Rhodohalobacter sulfatireducens]